MLSLPELNLTDVFVWLMLVATVVVLALYWGISAILVVVNVSNSGRSLRSLKSFFHFAVVSILLLVNLVVFYWFTWGHQDRRPLFGKNDFYPFLWLPLNLLVSVGLGKISYRYFSTGKNSINSGTAAEEGF